MDITVMIVGFAIVVIVAVAVIHFRLLLRFFIAKRTSPLGRMKSYLQVLI